MRIVAELERPRQMRLQAVGRPDPLHRVLAHADGFGHRPRAPMRGGFGLLLRGLLHDPRHRLGRDGGRAAGTRCVLFDSGRSQSGESTSPTSDGRFRGVEFGGNGFIGFALGRRQNDFRTQHQTRGRASSPRPSSQRFSFVVGKHNCRRSFHGFHPPIKDETPQPPKSNAI